MNTLLVPIFFVLALAPILTIGSTTSAHVQISVNTMSIAAICLAAVCAFYYATVDYANGRSESTRNTLLWASFLLLAALIQILK